MLNIGYFYGVMKNITFADNFTVKFASKNDLIAVILHVWSEQSSIPGHVFSATAIHYPLIRL